MFGSSTIKMDSVVVMHFSDLVGKNLSLERLNGIIWFILCQCYGGIELFNDMQKLKLLKQVGHFPYVILMQCGSNDLGRPSCAVKTYSSI